MRIGFEISDLSPTKAGVYTYSSQLLGHLARLANRPDLTLILIDGQGERTTHLPSGIIAAQSSTEYARVRIAVPLLHTANGPWKKDYRTRHLAYAMDSRVLIPLRQWFNSIPLLAQWSLSRDVIREVDVYHWSDTIMLHLPGCAHVVTIHDTIPLRHREWQIPADNRYYQRKLKLMARHATRIIAVSESTRRDIIELLGVAPERIDVIPEAAGPEFQPPADPAAMRETLARHGLREGDYVFYVGTIEPRKNLVRLATAFKAAIERRPELTTRLVLAGRPGWLSGPIYAGLAVLGLGDRLLMPGRVPLADLPALLHGARAVAYVSLYEGFGLPPLEAMACGSAVVASNNTSIPEVVGDAGLLVDPYDVGEIAAALERVLTDDALREELVARGRRQAARFSWEGTARMTLEAYHKAVADRRRVSVMRVGEGHDAGENRAVKK